MSAFDELVRSEPRQPVYAAYLGSALSLMGRDAWMPWNKMKYVEQGTDRIDAALAALKPEHDRQFLRGVPVSVATMFVAAATLLKIPDAIFHRRADGKRVLARLLGHPALASAPPGFRAAADEARKDERPGEEAAQLASLLSKAWPELRVVATVPNGVEALAAIERERPDVAFLDIRMPGLTGLEVAAELADRLDTGERSPAIVFVTAYDEHALAAFELAALDYLLKPVTEERLARTVERLKAALEQPADLEALVARLSVVLGSAPARAAREPLRHIQAGSGNSVKLIPIEEILSFRAADKYTSVATRDGREALIRTPLKELLERLPSERFRQIHRGTIVNLDEVLEAVRDDAGRLALRLKHGNEALPVSRIYAELFRQM